MFNRIIIFIILVIGFNFANAKKLKIHRCVLANGTIAFQETKCKKNEQSKQNTVSKNNQNKINPIKPSIKKHRTVRSDYSKPIPVKYQKLANVSTSDQSTKTISDQVKSYNISITGLKKWSIFKKVYNNKLLHIKFLNDQPGAELSLRIDFIFPDNKYFTEDELTELVNLVGSQFSNSSREGMVIPENMNVNNGSGVMATFTGLNLDSNYKYTTKGAIFKGKWLIQFTMLSMNMNSYSHQYALQELFSSIKITQ